MTPEVPDPPAPPFRWLDDDEQRSWRGLLMGMTLLTDRLAEELRDEFGLSLEEYEILVRLSEGDGRLRMSQLADSLAHSRSRTTHTVKRMEQDGLIERRQTPEDGRGIIAALTPAGYALLEQMAPVHVRGVRASLVDLVSREDFAVLGRVMNTVADHLVSDHPGLEMRRG